MRPGIVASGIRPVLASDAFSRANGNLSGTIAGGVFGGVPYVWAHSQGNTASSWLIDANRAKRGGTGARYMILPIAPVSDVLVSARVSQLPNAGDFISLLARYTEVPSFDVIRLRVVGTGGLLIQRVLGGVSTNLTASNQGAPVVGDIIRLLCRGATIEAWKNDTRIYSVTDTAVTGPAAVGLHAQGANGTDGAWDDFIVEAA